MQELLAPLAGHKIEIICIAGDIEVKDFALDFVEAFRGAHWTGVENGGVSQTLSSGQDPIGITVNISAADYQANTIPPEARAVRKAIGTVIGTTVPGEAHPEIPRGEVQLFIGTKPLATH